MPVRAASALPSPVVEPPPTETTESAPTSFARASATSVTSTGVCAAAPSNTPAVASPSTPAAHPPQLVGHPRHGSRAEDGPRRVGVVLEGVHGPSSGSWTDHRAAGRGTAALVEAGPRVARVTLSPRVRLVLASALMLFVELALIRWTSSNNLYLVHLTNFVLLASFLGIGLGFLRANATRDLFPLAPVLLAALVGFVLAFPVRTGTGRGGSWQLVGLFGMPPLPRPLSLAVVFLLTVGVLMALAQEAARAFASFAPLDAYRLDIFGSLTGIVTFAALSFLRLPPVGWAVAAAAAFAVLLGRRLRGWPAVAIAALVLMLGAESLVGTFQWSPYYKIHTQEAAGGLVRIEVNNTPLQTALPVEEIRSSSPFYLYPYTYAGSRDDVLVIGAGTGND